MSGYGEQRGRGDPQALRIAAAGSLTWQAPCRDRSMPQELPVSGKVNDTARIVRISHSRFTVPKLDQPGKWIAAFIAIEIATILLLMSFIVSQRYLL